jgi:hypothetical protein
MSNTAGVMILDLLVGHLVSAIRYAELHKQAQGNLTLEDVEAIEKETNTLIKQFKENVNA